MIRRATHEDIPFLLDLARECYSRPFDDRAAATFLTRAMGEPSMIVLRSERGAAVASTTRQFYDEPRAYLMFLLARPGRGLAGDGVRLVRAVDAWRRARGAISLHFGEDTGANFAILARRVGAKPDRPSYIIEGGEVAAAATAPSGSGSTLLDRVLLSPHLLGGRAPLKLVAD